MSSVMVMGDGWEGHVRNFRASTNGWGGFFFFSL